ncbi:MAG: succinate dehydrogenase, cytochrome b556 subunit [Anaerolineales bacterium]
MDTQSNKPSPSKFLTWFNPVGRDTGGWAFILNRITALGLTFYLFLHLVILGQLAKGPQGYNSFIELMSSPIWITGELLVVAAAFLHGLNGIRIILTTFGVSVTRQKQLFYGLMVIALIAILIFGFHMFSA